MKKVLSLDTKIKMGFLALLLIFILSVLISTLFSTNLLFISTNSITEYYCADGWTKAGDGPSAHCQKFKNYNYTCPSGTKKTGSGENTYCEDCENTYYCESGWRKTTGSGKPYCQKET